MRLASALAAALALSAGLASAQPASALRDAALAQVALCLKGDRWAQDQGHLAITPDQAPRIPAGMRSARIPTAASKLVVYEDDGRGSVIECGVALYGPAPAFSSAAFRQAITQAKAGFRAASPDAGG